MNVWVKFLCISVPYVLGLTLIYDFMPIPFDIVSVLALTAGSSIAFRLWFKNQLPQKKPNWVCLGCGKLGNKSPCPRCSGMQFKII